MKNIITVDEFNECLKNNYAIFMLYTKWCPLCKKMKFTLMELNDEYERIDFNLIDISEETTLSKYLHIKSTPTLLLYKDGILYDHIQGYLEYDDVLERILSLIS